MRVAYTLMAPIVMAMTLTGAHAASNPTIDVMSTNTFGGYAQTYNPGQTFQVFQSPSQYFLSNGSSWTSGAGGFFSLDSKLESVAVNGTTIQYKFQLPADGIAMNYTDYDSGDHSSQGVLATVGDLVIEAQEGASIATMKGWLEVRSNTETWYGVPKFNYYSAPVGAKVYFQNTYRLDSGTFSSTLFNGSFSYHASGMVDFTSTMPVPEPASSALMLLGMAALLAVRKRQ